MKLATWDDVSSFVRSNWPVAGEVEGFLTVEFGTGEGRTQMTGIRLMSGGTEPRLRIESQFGFEGDLDPAAALKMNGVLPLGAIAADEDGRLIYAHSMMLGTLDLASLDIALKTIAFYADQLEQHRSIDDRY